MSDDALVSLDGRNYISSAHAAQITGYTIDYISQLARSGKILARTIGHKWYVDKTGILQHRRDKDAVIAQAQRSYASYGYGQPSGSRAVAYSYSENNSSLIPTIKKDSLTQTSAIHIGDNMQKTAQDNSTNRQMPIRRKSAKTHNLKIIGASAVAISCATLLYFGFGAVSGNMTSNQSNTASVASTGILDYIESLIAPSVVYDREYQF